MESAKSAYSFPGEFMHKSRWTRLPLIGLPLVLAASAVAAQAAAPPSPEQVFGFRPGADYKLADYPMIANYFRTLAAAAPERIKVVEIGKTAEGQTQIMAILSSPENLKRLERYREISRRLALARGLTEEQARALAAEGRAIVWIDSGLHASEVAHGQHAPELAYRVVTDESEETRFIRDQVVLLQVPVMNPDGLNLVAAWYRKNVGTPYELAEMPWLYHKYVGHDNNRDWYMMTQPETRNVARLLYHEWFPQIVYNHHQSGSLSPRIVVPPYDDPMNPNIPPLVMRGVHLVGDAIAARFARERKPGVVSRVSYDTWWNGGMRTAPYFHNMVGILTETALFRFASPRFYKPEELPRTLPNGMPYTEPSTFNPHPWKGGWWRLRDAVEYELTASLAVLDIGARMRQDWLLNIYRTGKAAIEAGEQGSPYAYVAPPDQWDVGSAVEMLRALRLSGVEIHRARAEFSADGRAYPSGSHVVLSAQPFRPYILDLLEPQQYPDLRQSPGGPPKRPYDITGWTLPLQMGVEVKRVEKRFEAQLEPVELPAATPAAAPEPGAEAYVLGHRQNNFARACNRLLRAGVPVWLAREKFADSGREFEAGSLVVAGGARAAEVLAAIARELSLPAAPLKALPSSGLLRWKAPRVGLYQSWVANMDEGWTRWLLEQFEFSYTTLHDSDIRGGNLRGRFDAVVLPAQEFRSLLLGHQPGEPPEREAERGREPRVQRPEYTGGLGLEGALQLKQFAEAGGTLVALDGAANLPIQSFGIPVRNVLAGLRSEEFYAPGSLLRVQVDTGHPLTFGMKKDAIAFFMNSPAFEVFEGATAKVLAHYPLREALASGWLLGERRLTGRAALVEAPLGKGRVVLIGFRSQFRAQSHNTFKVLFNSLYYSATELH